MQALLGSAAFAVGGVRARQTRCSVAAQPLCAVASQRPRAAAAASHTRSSCSGAPQLRTSCRHVVHSSRLAPCRRAALSARASVGCRLPAAPVRAARRRVAACEARRGGGGEDSPTVSERLVSAIPYLLPLLDGVRYGACTSRACTAHPGSLQPAVSLAAPHEHVRRCPLRCSPVSAWQQPALTHAARPACAYLQAASSSWSSRRRRLQSCRCSLCFKCVQRSAQPSPSDALK